MFTLHYGVALTRVDLPGIMRSALAAHLRMKNPDYDPEEHAPYDDPNTGEHIDPGIPEYIEFYDEGSSTIPTGLVPYVQRWAEAKGPVKLEGFPAPLRFPPKVELDLIPGITLRQYQADTIATALQKQRGILEIATGGGKCLGRGTPVLLYSGEIVPVEGVKVGDRLMGPDSKPRTVRSTTVGYGPLYKVTPTRGDTWVCNDAHILTLVRTNRYTGRESRVNGKVEDVPLQDYLKASKAQRHVWKQFSVPVDFQETEGPLPVDPYFVGLWLGDGAKSRGKNSLLSVRITNMDPEVHQAIQETADSWGAECKRIEFGGLCPEFLISTARGKPNPLLDEMRSLFPEDCSIPLSYLTSTRRDRLSLLAGLIDSDGHLHRTSYEITQRRTELADGVCHLARSLGFKVVRSIKNIDGVSYQRMSISGPTSEVPVRIPRKRAPERRQKKDPLRVGIHVDYIGEGEYFGFTLDGDGRFLLGDYTVTHNTEIAIGITLALGTPRTIYVVPDRAAMYQMHKRYVSRGMEDQVGRLGDNLFEIDKPVVIGIINSFYSAIKKKDERVLRIMNEAELFIADEVHHQGTATSWQVAALQCPAPYRYGLSGTPYKDDKSRFNEQYLHPHDSWLTGLLGPTLVYIPASKLQEQGDLAPVRVISFDAGGEPLSSPNWGTMPAWQRRVEWKKAYDNGVIFNEVRNQRIVNLAANLVYLGRRPIISVKSRSHGRNLQRMLFTRGLEVMCSYGSGDTFLTRDLAERLRVVYEEIDVWSEEMTPKLRKEKKRTQAQIDVLEEEGAKKKLTKQKKGKLSRLKTKLKKFPKLVGTEEDFVLTKETLDFATLLDEGTIDLIVGSVIYDEAQDLPVLTDIINAAGGDKQQRYRQKVGRVLRLHTGKKLACVWEPWDSCHSTLEKHSRNRLETAAAQGFPVSVDDPFAEVLVELRLDLMDLHEGVVLMEKKTLEITYDLTIPVNTKESGKFSFVKPRVSICAELEPGDDLRECSEALSREVKAVFVQEALRQATTLSEVLHRGFATTAKEYLSYFETASE